MLGVFVFLLTFIKLQNGENGAKLVEQCGRKLLQLVIKCKLPDKESCNTHFLSYEQSRVGKVNWEADFVSVTVTATDSDSSCNLQLATLLVQHGNVFSVVVFVVVGGWSKKWKWKIKEEMFISCFKSGHVVCLWMLDCLFCFCCLKMLHSFYTDPHTRVCLILFIYSAAHLAVCLSVCVAVCLFVYLLYFCSCWLHKYQLYLYR